MLAKRLLAGLLGAKPSITYNGEVEFNVSSTNIVTASSLNFGAEHPTRIVAVFIGAETSGNRTISSVTIGGVSATRAIRVSNAATLRQNEIWYAQIPTGSTGNVTVTFSSATTISGLIAISSIYNTLSTAPAVGSSFDTTLTYVSGTRALSITPPANGVLFAGYSAGLVDASASCTWTSAVEQHDAGHAISPSHYSTAIADKLPPTSRTVIVSITDPSVFQPGLVVASWG